MILSVVEFVHCKPRSYCKIWMDCVYAIVCTIIWECKTWFYHPCHNRVNFKRNWKRTNKTFYKVIYRVIDLEMILVDILDRTVSPKKTRVATCSCMFWGMQIRAFAFSLWRSWDWCHLRPGVWPLVPLELSMLRLGDLRGHPVYLTGVKISSKRKSMLNILGDNFVGARERENGMLKLKCETLISLQCMW